MHPPDFKILKRLVSENTLAGVLESLTNIEAGLAMCDDGSVEPKAQARTFKLMRFTIEIDNI